MFANMASVYEQFGIDAENNRPNSYSTKNKEDS